MKRCAFTYLSRYFCNIFPLGHANDEQAEKPDAVYKGAADIWEFFKDKDLTTNTKGGCKDHKERLEKAWGESYKLVTAALKSINFIEKHPRPPITEPKDQWIWNKQARLMTSFFGVQMDKNGGPKQEGDNKRNFDFIKSIFELMKSGMEDGGQDRRAALFCEDDSAWKFFDQDTKIPKYGAALKEIPSFAEREDLKDGGWNLGLYWIQKRESNEKVQICDTPKGNVLAEVFTKCDLFVLCNRAFKEPRNIEERKGEMEVNIPLDVDAFSSVSYTIVHEFAHFYGSSKYNHELLRTSNPRFTLNDIHILDKTALDKKGERIPGTASYGTKFIMRLAEASPKDAKVNADSYARFAVASFLDEWDWSSGKAKGFIRRWI